MNTPKQIIRFKPNPDNIIVRLTKKAWEKLFYKDILNDEGKKIRLFTSVEKEEGFEDRFTQFLSVGEIVAVGTNIKDIIPHEDVAIIDYLVSNDPDCLMGFVNGDRIVSILAKTTYHTEDAEPFEGRMAFAKGDIDVVSPLYGVVRDENLISFSPYVFFEDKKANILLVSETGVLIENRERFLERKAISVPASSVFDNGDDLGFQDGDHFSFSIGDKQICGVFQQDIMYSKKKKP